MQKSKFKNFDEVMKNINKLDNKLNLSKEDAIYLAGIIDGEGSVGVFTRNGNKKWVRPHLQIVNNNFDLLNWLQKRIKFGSIYIRKDKRKNRKRGWNWRVACNNAIIVLKEVFPYLIVKKKNAEILLSLWGYENIFNRISSKIPFEIQKIREEVFDEIKVLNYRAKYKQNYASNI